MKLVAILSNRKKLSASSSVRHSLNVQRKDDVTVIGIDGLNVRMRIYRIPLHAAGLEAVTKTRGIYMNKRIMSELGIRQGDMVTAQRAVYAAPRDDRPALPSSNGGGGIGSKILGVLSRTAKSTKEIAEAAGLTTQQVRDAIRNLEKKGTVSRDESNGLKFAKA